MLFAHAGHGEEVAANNDLLTTIGHQPTLISLCIIVFVLFAIYSLLGVLKVKPLNRFLLLIPLLIVIALFYMQHNPLITTIALSIGFIGTFFITFTILAKKEA